MAYAGTCCWTGCGFWPLCPEPEYVISMQVCLNRSELVLNREWMHGLSSLNMTYTVFHNTRLEMFAGL